MTTAKRVRCPCGGWAECRLCGGQRHYDYTPTERGWLPFRCPTCAGAKAVTFDGEPEPCQTCRGEAIIDPANPPSRGFWGDFIKAVFGITT